MKVKRGTRDKEALHKSKLKAKDLWQSAYDSGCITLDFTDKPDAVEQTTKVYYFLGNFRKACKKKRLDNLLLVEQMEACSLRRLSKTVIQISRNGYNPKANGTYLALLSDSLPVERHTEPENQFKESRAKLVLNKFKKSMMDACVIG